MAATAEKKTYKSSAAKPAASARLRATIELNFNTKNFGGGSDPVEYFGRELEYFAADFGTDWTVEVEEVDA